jgi:hypothetical protein
MARTITGERRLLIGLWQRMMALWQRPMAMDRRVTKAGDTVNA